MTSSPLSGSYRLIDQNTNAMGQDITKVATNAWVSSFASLMLMPYIQYRANLLFLPEFNIFLLLEESCIEAISYSLFDIINCYGVITWLYCFIESKSLLYFMFVLELLKKVGPHEFFLNSKMCFKLWIYLYIDII